MAMLVVKSIANQTNYWNCGSICSVQHEKDNEKSKWIGIELDKSSLLLG